MKLCMLSTGHEPVDDRIYYKEALSLSSKYSDIAIIGRGDNAGSIKNNKIKIIPLKNSGSILSRVLLIPRAVKMIVQIKPDVCHFHDYELIFALPFLKIFSRCKIIYDVHEVYPEMIESSMKIPRILRPYMTKLVDLSERMLSHLTDYIITSDENISKRFTSNKHVATIFNYPRLSIFTPDENKLFHLRQRYNGRIPIIYQGGMSADRGLFKMIEAMQLLKNKRPDIILLLAGEMSGELFKRAKEEIQQKGLSNSIDILGWIPHEDVVNYMYVSKIGLVPLLPTKKYTKNIPIKQFEYMACGIPVLGADLPPISSYVISSGCGRVYDSTSSEALAFEILNILEDESGWKRMSEAGKAATQNWWNWGKMEEKLFFVYNELT
ncbi:glycosyltransferase [candidate division WS5 bacterium]|uniref:Glycosyltransferase n=1 Tax=candidate division WS5 bacterium TaxID=2093353 RepID=A0A419DBG7_9BACT|nr:MAG: glycosyltransferase [candidate division WS5 bacterium]